MGEKEAHALLNASSKQGQSLPPDTPCAGKQLFCSALSNTEPSRRRITIYRFWSHCTILSTETKLPQLTQSWHIMVPATHYLDLAVLQKRVLGYHAAGQLIRNASHTWDKPKEKIMQKLRTGPSEEDPASWDCSYYQIASLFEHKLLIKHWNIQPGMGTAAAAKPHSWPAVQSAQPSRDPVLHSPELLYHSSAHQKVICAQCQDYLEGAQGNWGSLL